jgi:hypothetical protein
MVSPTDEALARYRFTVDAMLAPFRLRINAYDRVSQAKFLIDNVGTLVVAGVPILSCTEGSNRLGYKHANKLLSAVGSNLRVRTGAISTHLQMIFGEPVLTRCTEKWIIVGREVARTALLAMEVPVIQV